MLSWIGVHVAEHYRNIVPAAGGTFDDRFSEAVARSFQQSPHAFLVVGVTLLLSVQLFSLGMLALQAKQYFEELFHFGTRVYAHTQELEKRLDERAQSAGPKSE